jgi:hypothetical protein
VRRESIYPWPCWRGRRRAARAVWGRDVGFMFAFALISTTRCLDFSLTIAYAWVLIKARKQSYSPRRSRTTIEPRLREARYERGAFFLHQNFLLCVNDCWTQGMPWPTRHTLWVRPCNPPRVENKQPMPQNSLWRDRQLRDYRKASGLCFNCGDKFVPRHLEVCPKTSLKLMHWSSMILIGSCLMILSMN